MTNKQRIKQLFKILDQQQVYQRSIGKLDDLLPAGAEAGSLRVQNNDIVKAVE